MRRILARIFFGLLLLIALLVAAVVAIDTGPGHGFATRLIAGLKPANGLRYSVGAIDGSIYGRMTLRGVVVSDLKGVVATIPAVTVDWHPGSLIHKKVAADLIDADLVTVLRRPELIPQPGPLLPDIDIAIERFAVRQLVLEAPVTGKREVIALTGDTDIASGRAKVNADVTAVTGGDRLTFKLDAVPDADRFMVDAHLMAPAGGVVDGLAKLGKPIAADISGAGTWTAWQGKASAMLGGNPLLDLALTAKSGTFSATGSAHPGLVVPSLGKLTEPALAVTATAVAANRVVDADVHLSSPALDLTARGKLDLGAGRYDGIKVAARLLKPAAAMANVSGRDVRAALALDGPFATPTIDYTVTAATLGFGANGVENLTAKGIATVDARQIRLPLHLTASRVTGVDSAVGGLLRNVRVDGDIIVNATQVASDNLRLRSDQIDATVVAALTLATGDYTAALKGRINRYLVAGVGLVDLVTDARLVPAGKGLVALKGNVRATTVRIDNASARDFLGGNAVVTAVIERAPNGLISVGALRVVAPKFRITGGSGSYRSDGRIAFTATGSQAQYGPFNLVASGTVAKPQVTLRAKRPNVGVQLSDVVATLRPAPGGYAVTASGASPYGTFAVDAGLRIGKGPLVANIRRASLAGLIVTGEVAATPAGPYTGALNLTGPGLTGSIRLAAAGAVQRADVTLHAANARVPLPEPLLIATGDATATALLYPNAPQVSGSGSFTGIRQGTLAIAHAKASGDYRGGSGHVDFTADGTSGVPFTIAANAAMTPSAIKLDGRGTISGVALRLAAPAEIARTRDGYRLQPATIVLPNGRVVVSGSSGATTALDARLDAVDLGLAEAFKPGLGLGGKASGVITATLPAGGGIPNADVNLTIAGFNRAGIASLSAPVDIAVLGALSARGGEAHAVLRRAGAVLGRAEAHLAAIPATGAGWSDRLLAAPLTGGVRYNGPAELLWALGGVAGQQLSGPLAIGADFSGHIGAPQVRGLLRGKGLRYENSAFGTVVDQLDLDSRFNDTRLDIISLTGRAGEGGSIGASGYADLAADKGFPIDIRVKVAKARLARSKSIDATVSGTLAVTNDKAKGAVIAGDLVLDRTRYTILRPAAAEVVELDGVRRKNAAPVVARPAAGPPSVFKLAIKLTAPNQIFVEGMGLEAEWRAALNIGGTADAPVIVGQVTLERGTYAFGGRRFDLSRGIVRFAGETPPNPTLDIEATTTVDGLTAIIDITGRAYAPEIAFTSTPALAQDEVLSRLLFGSSNASLTPTQALQLASSLNTLRGSSGGGFNPLGTLRKATGIDRLRLLGGDKTTGAGPSVAAGKYISNRIYVEVTSDAKGYSTTQLEIGITRTLRLLSAVSSFGTSNVGVKYSRDY
nr:translocation/assembly module TamB domain-containing protein [Polymorphobacter sp.]